MWGNRWLFRCVVRNSLPGVSRLHIDRVPFLAVLDWLKHHELIICRKGYKPNHGSGRYTRIWAGKELQRIFDEMDWTPERIIGDCIELKDKGKNLISFNESDVSEGLRSDLKTINSTYLKHYFTHETVRYEYYYNNHYAEGKSEYNKILKERNITVREDTESKPKLLKFISTATAAAFPMA